MQKSYFISTTSIILISLFFLLPNNVFAEENKPSGAVEEEYDDEDFDFDFNDSSSKSLKIYDPLEKVNRKIFAFNEVFDKYIFEPVAKGYRKVIPKFVRKSIRNFVTNLSLPLVTINSALQGNVENSLSSFSHFLINSTIGIGGLFDVATKKDIKYRDEDFGQTFAKYGVGQGPYLVIPFLGPSSFRDGTGLVTEKLADPLSFNILEVGGERKLADSETLVSLAIIEAIDKRESLIELIDNSRKDSFDFYATTRSAYIQNRDFEINNK